MKGPTKEETAKALAAFVEFEDEPAPRHVLDRSTLERFATCPAQAAYVASGRINNSSLLAAAGEAVHVALGTTLADYIAQFDETGTCMSPRELRAESESNIMGARPDVQPQAVKGLRASLWDWSVFIARINPTNILRFDGGTGDRSGQLAWDLGEVRVTSELDLLHAGASPELLHEVDYKSGWKCYGAGHVAESFQFQLHAWLVLNNYQNIDALEVRVWNSRSNRLSPAVYFYRDGLSQIEARIRSAIGIWFANYGKAPEACEVWPAVERCCICPAAVLCHAACHPQDLVNDPPRFILTLAALEARVDAMRSLAAYYVDATGQDIVTPDGTAFGRGKPAATRKAPAKVYHLTNGDSDNGESTEAQT